MDFGQRCSAAVRLAQSIASVDGGCCKAEMDAVAEEPQPQTDETSVYSPPGAEEELGARLPRTRRASTRRLGAAEAQPTVNTSADEFAALAAAQEDDSESEEEEGDDAEDARKSGFALKPPKKSAASCVEQLQRDNDRLQASARVVVIRARGSFKKSGNLSRKVRQAIGGRDRGEIGHCILQISVQEGARRTGGRARWIPEHLD